MSEKQHLQKALKSNVRIDGRKLDEFRNVTVEKGVIKNAEGSARVQIGDTLVLAGVKMGVESPYPDTPNNGNLMVNAELLPLSSPDYEAGPPGAEAVEVARVVDRGIRESEAIDTEKLVIEKGEKVWAVMIDVVSMNVDGNLLDAAGLAALAALQDAKMPTYADGVVDYKKLTKQGVPLKEQPIPVTVYKAEDVLLIDPTDSEEDAISARLTVAVTEEGRVCAMQKGGDEVLSIDDVDQMVQLAVKKSKELRGHL